MHVILFLMISDDRRHLGFVKIEQILDIKQTITFLTIQ